MQQRITQKTFGEDLGRPCHETEELSNTEKGTDLMFVNE